MSNNYTYVVGKPNPKSDLLNTAHRMGYKLGVLLDKNVKLASKAGYDRIIPIDFSHIDTEIVKLRQLDLKAVGLLCTYENYLIAKSKIGQALKLPVLSLESTEACTNKLLMRQSLLKANPLITPNFAKISSLQQALDFADSYGYPLIIKPTDLVKSLLISKSNGRDELIEHYNNATKSIANLYKIHNIYDREPQLIIEEFMKGKQYTIASLVDHTGKPHFCDGIVEITTASDIGINDTYLYRRSLPSSLQPETMASLLEVATQGITALGIKSAPAHIELIHGEKGTKIIEIGARTGGYRPRMYDYSYNINLDKQELLLSTGQIPNTSGKFRSFCAVYELFPETSGRFTSLANDISHDSVTYHRIAVKPGDPIGPAKDGFKAVAIIIVSDSQQDRFKQKCKQVEQIKIGVS